jgi:hypothetical protein
VPRRFALPAKTPRSPTTQGIVAVAPYFVSVCSISALVFSTRVRRRHVFNRLIISATPHQARPQSAPAVDGQQNTGDNRANWGCLPASPSARTRACYVWGNGANTEGSRDRSFLLPGLVGLAVVDRQILIGSRLPSPR